MKPNLYEAIIEMHSCVDKVITLVTDNNDNNAEKNK